MDALRPYAASASALAQSLVTFDGEPIEDTTALERESAALRALLDDLGSPLKGRAGRPAAQDPDWFSHCLHADNLLAHAEDHAAFDGRALAATKCQQSGDDR